MRQTKVKTKYRLTWLDGKGRLRQRVFGSRKQAENFYFSDKCDGTGSIDVRPFQESKEIVQ